MRATEVDSQRAAAPPIMVRCSIDAVSVQSLGTGPITWVTPRATIGLRRSFLTFSGRQTQSTVQVFALLIIVRAARPPIRLGSLARRSSLDEIGSKEEESMAVTREIIVTLSDRSSRPPSQAWASQAGGSARVARRRDCLRRHRAWMSCLTPAEGVGRKVNSLRLRGTDPCCSFR